ncbi:hypothetical protein Sjap_001566 [Stephania japonica]|uniref:MLO-like protein n=1 Tax=Stephania japonica TaxID=461633 RepID=A0AAP0KK75_9MAGN
MAGAGKAERSLKETPTWAVAVVCFVLVLISIFIEFIIHFIGKWLKKKHMSSLHEALEKVKAELMLLGFISLLLTVGQGPISRMCIPESVADTWHPCKKVEATKSKIYKDTLVFGESPIGRRLLSGIDYVGSIRRSLAGAAASECKEARSIKHIPLFLSFATYSLSRAKMRRWEAWENETRTAEYQFSHDQERFRFVRDTTFGRRHFNIWSKSPILLWIACFFRQFTGSVKKVDYLTLRHGFIMSSNLVFRGSLPTLQHSWLVLLSVAALHTTHYHSIGVNKATSYNNNDGTENSRQRRRGTQFIPAVCCTQLFENDIITSPLFCFTLFCTAQNAFQLAFFVWTWYEFGLRSCFHERVEDVTIRISMGIIVQFICSYVTLPLYALVTQMGSSMRPTVFNDRVAVALKRWHHTARKHIKENRHSKDVTPNSSMPSTPMHGFSPVHLLSYHQAIQDRHDFVSASPRSPRSTIWDGKRWENEESPSPPQRVSTELQEQTQDMELAKISLPISQTDHAQNEIDHIGPADQYRINIGSSSNKEFSFQKRQREQL